MVRASLFLILTSGYRTDYKCSARKSIKDVPIAFELVGGCCPLILTYCRRYLCNSANPVCLLSVKALSYSTNLSGVPSTIPSV